MLGRVRAWLEEAGYKTQNCCACKILLMTNKDEVQEPNYVAKEVG